MHDEFVIKNEELKKEIEIKI